MTTPTPPDRPANSKLKSLTVAVLAAVALLGGAVITRGPSTPSTPPVVSDSTPRDSAPRDSAPRDSQPRDTQPPVVVPPVVDSAPLIVAGGLSGLQLVGDDFTAYPTRAALLAVMSVAIGGTGDVHAALYHDGRGAALIALDSAVRYHGHPSLRYTFPVGSGPPELWPQLPHALDVAWYRTKIRFAPGFTTDGHNPNAANAYKLLGMGWAAGGGNGRLDFAITNTTEYQLEFNVQIGGTVVAESPFAVGGHVTTEWSDGGWYDYIVEYNRTSPTSATARAWRARDGSPPVLVATSSTTRTDGGTLPQIGSVMLGLNYNQPILAPMALYYGQWEVVDGTQHPDPFGVHGGVN